MKNMLRIMFMLIAVPIFFGACNKDGDNLVVSSEGSPELVASTQDVDLDNMRSDDDALVLSWSTVSVSWSDNQVANGSISYVLELAPSGSGFRDSVARVDIPVQENSYAFSIGNLNALLAGIGLEIGQRSAVDVRVVASLAANASLYSNVVSFSAIPYTPTSYLYVPGAYQGWDMETAESLVSPTSNGVYTGIIYFPTEGSEFKVTTARSWDMAYGDAGEGTISTNASDNIKSPSSGNLELTVDTKNNTISFSEHSWGVIGDATPGGWDVDTDLYYNNMQGTWSITLELHAGLFKFRKNHDWEINLGGPGGNLTDGGDNIGITEAGTYEIVLNVNSKTYTLTKK